MNQVYEVAGAVLMCRNEVVGEGTRKSCRCMVGLMERGGLMGGGVGWKQTAPHLRISIRLHKKVDADGGMGDGCFALRTPLSVSTLASLSSTRRSSAQSIEIQIFANMEKEREKKKRFDEKMWYSGQGVKKCKGLKLSDFLRNRCIAHSQNSRL